MEIWMNSAEELSEMVKSGKIDTENLIQEYSKRIEKYDSNIKSFIQFEKNPSYLKEKKGKNDFPIPYALKDNILSLGFRTTCASKILWNFQSSYDSTVNLKLKNIGGILMGKNNLDEFAMGTSTEFSSFFTTKNPWDSTRIPGGSSGGSAAAVASCMIPFSLGSDTGGSIRIPASFCGIVGYKPTYGLVSRYGLVAFSSSMDQIGPLCRSVRDAAIITEKISGLDDKDSTSAKSSVNFKDIEKDIKDMRFVIVSECYKSMDPDIKFLFDENVSMLKWMGVSVDEISFSEYEMALSVYHIISTAEASSNLARFDGVRYGLRVNADTCQNVNFSSRSSGFGDEVKRRIILGTYNLSSDNYPVFFEKAQKIRRKLKHFFDKIFKKYDAVISPTSPVLPYKIGECSDIFGYYKIDSYTVFANLGGYPAISVPMGFISGLPVGFHIMCNSFQDELLLRIARAFEKKCGVFEDNFYPVPHLEMT